MRKYFGIALFVLTLVLVGISCQKELNSPKDQNDVFNEKAAKEWYYGTFKKSAEWAASNLKGKKLPDWKHPVVGKLGNYEIVEFPLVSKTTSYPVYSNQANKILTTAEITRIASAAVSKIVFFKNDGEIFVREIDFIPDWDYLKEKKYDISDLSILNKEKDFSGNIIIKKWDGSLLSSVMYKNGQQTMKSKLVRVGKEGRSGEVNSIETLVCTDYQFCVWQQDCEIVINGDQMTTICEEWYNTGDCWIETFCEDDGEDCVLTGTCGNLDPDPEDCDMTESEAEDLLASVNSQILTDGTASSGLEIGPDPNGIIRKPVTVNRHGVRYNYWAGLYSRYSLIFTGVIFKHTNNTTWKFESIQFNSIPKTSGSEPICFTTVVTAAVAGPVISTDRTQASFTSTVTANLELTCAFGRKVRSMIDNIDGIYLAGDPVTIY